MNNYSKPNRYTPFSRLKVSVSDIDYDFDEMDYEEIEQVKSKLPTFMNLEYSADELLDYAVLSQDDNSTEWIINRDALEELISDYITNRTDFCHNGFRFMFSIVN